jgi:hypothetical protein|tara:strand:- start:53 stop:481 length:429 start_codon:yes stop_codon:yes gene_type:complete
METDSVKKSIKIKSDVVTAWNYLSKITTLDWIEGEKSTKFLTNKKRGIGAVRVISFQDGSDVEEHIVGWSPKKYFSYIAISGLPVNAYHATISITKINDSVKITWESYFSSKSTKSEFNEFTKFLSQFYVTSLQNLKNLLEK